MHDSKVEVLVAAVNKDAIELYNKMKIATNAVIANQGDTYCYLEKMICDRRVRVIETAGQGVGKNRNLALMCAEGEYLLFSDEDIVYRDGYEKMVIDAFERHPDAVVVVTTNISYEGCRGMNQSVIDRMSLVRDVELPELEVMVQRAMSVTGATDEYQVSQMVQVVNDLAEYCRRNSITDGSYGMRSLIDWIISTEITGDVYLSALYTIISKATADEMDREALISTVLEPIFAPSRTRAAV